MIVAEVQDLFLKFPGNQLLLFNNLTLSVRKGERVLLLGPSGCGKSTLLLVLSGLIPKAIELPMSTSRSVTPKSSGFIFQDPDSQFCMPYVDEEIAFSLENSRVTRGEMNSKIIDLLSMVNLTLPDPHTKIDTLSGGMKQRLAIAASLALDPEVLFLDEPTSMLDPDGTRSIWETIHQVGRDKTIVVVEHKLDHVLDLVERIILFDNQGSILADGNKDYVLKTYENEMINSGIWHPNAWPTYLSRRDGVREHLPACAERIALNNFDGLLDNKPKIQITNACVRAGEWVGISGSNGSGKTTLMLALMQLISTTGTYRLNNVNVNNIKDVIQSCMLVFQNPEHQFLADSVFDELAYSLRLEGIDEKEVTDRVEKLLSIFTLEKFRQSHPHHLSMGQKRRLSVATSLVEEVPVLLLDEPTLGLDAKNTFHLLELLEEHRSRGMTILMATHDVNILDYFATRVWKLEDGQLVWDKVRDEGGEEVT